jgi:hypothetical protein
MLNRCTLAFAASAISLVTVAPAAHADPAGPDVVPVAVLAVKSDEALDQAEAFTAALRTAVTNSKGWSLGQADQSLEFLALKMKCIEPIDAACETRIADVIKADRVLWSVIEFDKSKQEVVGTLNFFARGRGTSSTEVRFSARATDAAALREASAALFEKVSGGAPRGGINVSTGGVAAQLYVDEKPVGAVPADGATYQLSVGRHTVTLKAPGYEDATSQVQVQPLGTVEATFTLTATERRGSIDGRMVGGFGALGIGIAAGAVGAWAAVDVNGIRGDTGYRAYRDQFTTTDDVCQAARDNQAPRVSNPAASDAASVSALCDRASRDELLQAVGFPVAAIAAGIGGYLLGTSSLGKASDEAPRSAWTVMPMLGTTQQTLTFRYTY